MIFVNFRDFFLNTNLTNQTNVFVLIRAIRVRFIIGTKQSRPAAHGGQQGGECPTINIGFPPFPFTRPANWGGVIISVL